MAAGLAVLSVMENEEIVANAAAVGERLKTRLAELVDRYELLADVRGQGLMIGIEFGRPGPSGCAVAGRCSRRRARDSSRRWSWCRCSSATTS